MSLPTSVKDVRFRLFESQFMSISRRQFLVASSTGFAGLQLGSPTSVFSEDPDSNPNPSTSLVGSGKAKSVILFFLCGGASHIDTWDMKPDAPTEYRGPFSSIGTSAPGIRICEHLPLLAQQSHHLAVVNSVCSTVNTNDHHAGYYYNLTGHVPDKTFKTQGNDRKPYADDWPFMGSVVSSRKSSDESLHGAITLPHMPSRKPYTRPGQFSARLGIEFDPLYVDGNSTNGPDGSTVTFQAPSLVLSGDVTKEELISREKLLSRLQNARRSFDHAPEVELWRKQQQRSMDLLLASSTSEVFDISKEPVSIRERYGDSVNGMSLLMARRLVEAEVPFITVFWKENTAIKDQCKSAGGWDTHGNNFDCLKNHLLPEFDRAFSALLEDLSQRGLLEQTLVLVNSEMGRKPKIGDPRSGGVSGAGRDHWTHCMSVLMAGGGIQGGQTYGSSDRFGEYPEELPTTPADIARTVYHAAGVENLEARDTQGRPFHLLADGRVLKSLF